MVKRGFRHIILAPRSANPLSTFGIDPHGGSEFQAVHNPSFISRQTLALQSETAITPSSLAFDPPPHQPSPYTRLLRQLLLHQSKLTLKGGVNFKLRISPQLPLSGFRRVGRESSRAKVNFERGAKDGRFIDGRRGENGKGDSAFGARTTTPRSRQTIAPHSRLTPLGTARN